MDAGDLLIQTEPIAVDREQAARLLGVSLAHFKRHIQPQLRAIYTGQLTRYPTTELRRWAEREAGARARKAG